MASFDSNNLMYVTKQYEHEIQDKVKQIYANDETAVIVENVDKQLNAVLKEINSKLSFMDSKVIDANQYRIGVHTQIDETKVDIKSLVDDGLEESSSHPSSNAFKSDRLESKFSTYDFINKSLSFDRKGFVNLHGINETGEETVHSFTIKHSLEEYMKIVEFAFTYKQYPTIMNKTSQGLSEESTVTVTRVFRGRFFIIWADPYLEPGKFIVKAIIENADNTGNIIDKRIIDVKRSDSGEDLTVILDDGPQFDLFFTTTGDDVTVSIGRLTPYRWLIRKQYSNIYGEEAVNFEVHNSANVNTIHLDEVHYSVNCDSYFIVDKTDNQMGYVSENNNIDSLIKLSNNSAIAYNGETVSRFLFKDVGKYTFVTINDKSYACISNLGSAILLDKIVDDVFEISTGEILCTCGSSILYFNTSSNAISTNNFIDFTPYAGISTVPSVIEHDDRVVVFYINDSGKIAYKIREKYSATGKYQDSNKSYSESELDNFTVNENASTIKLMSIDTPYGIQMVCTETINNNEVSSLFNIDNLVISSNIAIFNNIHKLSKYDIHEKQYDNDYTFSVEKIVHTPLFTFMINKTSLGNKLYIIDRERIIDPLSFAEVYDNDNNLLGYSDKSGMIYMKPEENQSEYFIKPDAYLQNVVDVLSTPNGTYIVDEKGVYLLNSDKNLKCMFYTDETDIIGSLLYSNKSKTAGSIIVKDVQSGIYNMYRNDYNIKPISNVLVKNEYLDLYSDDYQLYDEDTLEYVNDKPIVKFDSILYVTFVDHGSVLYNTDKTVSIEYSDDKTINDVSKERTASFDRIQSNATSKEYNGVFTPVKMTISPNKYGFKLYKDILKLDTNKVRVSGLNDIKKYVIRHHKGDSVSLQNIENTIIKLLDDQYDRMISENGTVTIEQFIIRDKRYWQSMGYEEGTYGARDVLNTCMKYFKHFPRHNNVTLRDYRSTNIFNTPVGRFLKLQDGLFEISSPNALAEGTYDESFNDDVVGSSENRVARLRNNYFHVEYINNSKKTIVLGGSSERSYIAVYNCYDPSTDEYSDPFSDPNKIIKLNQKPFNGFSIIDNKIYCWDSTDVNSGIYVYNPIANSMEQSTLTESISNLNVHVVGVYKVEDLIFISCLKLDSNNEYYNQIIFNPQTSSITDTHMNILFHAYDDSTNGMLKRFVSRMYKFKECTLLTVIDNGYKNGDIHAETSMYGDYSGSETGIKFFKYNATTKRFDLIKETSNIIHDVDLFEINGRIFGTCAHDSGYLFYLDADNYKRDNSRLPMKFEYLPKTDSFVQWHCDSVGYGRIHNFFNGVIIGEYPQNDIKNDIECHTIEDNDMRVWKNDPRYNTSLIHGEHEYIIRGNYQDDSFQGIPSVIAKSLKTGLEHIVFNENIASERYLTRDYHFKTVDTYPLAGKNYYHLDQQHTCFIAMKVVDLNSLHSYNNELLFNTFVRREISNNMIQLNTRIQTAPISSCVYYTKDLYNNFIEHTNLTKFDEGTVYYEHECDYIPLNVYLQSHENLTEQILVSSTNPVYRRAVVGDGFESSCTYYESVHLYDSRDSESVGKDPSLVISVTNNEYSLVIQNEDDKIYLQLGIKISISNSLCSIDNLNFVSHWLLNENKSAEYIDTTPNFVDTQYSRFVIGQTDVQLYSQDGELLLNQIMSDIDELNSKNVIIHGDDVYFLGYLNSDSTKYIKVYKYDPNGNRFVKHFEILGSSAHLIDTEYGVLVCVNKETEFTIYQLTDTGTEHILSKNEKILHQVSIPNTDGNIEVYTFVKTNNADFVKCYKILKNVASEVPVPDELLTGTNMVDYTISALPKNRAIIFGSFMIWYLDKNIVEPVINTVYKIEYEHNGSEIETINSNVIYEKNGSFKEIVGPNNELSINFVADSSTICGRENGIPSLSLGMGDPLKLGCDYGVNHVELPITNNDRSVVETVDGNDYRLNYNTDSKILFERMDSENTQLPILGEDGLLYFCNARIDNHTGLPDYENPYRAVDENGHILKDHISFDKVIIHNSKLYGLSKKDKKVYVNRDYINSNDFIVSFEDTSGNDSLDIDFVKHIGVIYLNSTECWILYNNYEESTESTDDWVRRDASGSNNVVSEDGKYITKTDYIFAIQKVDRTVILDKDISTIIAKTSGTSHTVYKTTIGLFIASINNASFNHLYAYNNELQKIYDSSTLYTTCRNDATKQVSIKTDILETRNGLIIITGTNGYLVFEAGVYSSGYEFVPYYDSDFNNISDADLFTLNFVIDKTSASEGYYKVRKLIDLLPVNKFVLRIDRDTYFDGCRIFRLYKTEDGYRCVELKIIIEDLDIEYKIDSLFSIHNEGFGMYSPIRNEQNGSYSMYYNKTRENTAVYYNGMIYFEYRYGGNIFVMNGSNSIGKEIEKETSDELSVGFELTFVSKNSDVWNGYEQDMNNSLADKLVIKLTGLYNKTAQEESSKLFNLKAFVVDNYESSIDRPYMAITEHNRLINRFPFILNNGSVDLKDLNIKRVLANEEVKNVLKNLINLDEYDETYNITMEIYPAVVSEVDSIEIREELSQNGIDMSDDYYKLRLNRNPSLPYDPFSSLSM